jgi:hypothetical protein
MLRKFIGNNVLDLGGYMRVMLIQFFHQLASSNKILSTISSLEINVSLSFDSKEIEKHIFFLL